jgi:methyl-accepting chemotaxis protein
MTSEQRGDSIVRRLQYGFGVLVLLLAIAGAVGWRSLSTMSRVMNTTLEEMQAEHLLAAQLSASVAQELESGNYYLTSRDTIAANDFRRRGWEAHRVQRQMNALPGQTPTELSIIAAIDSKLSEIEQHYALAHRLVDLGRLPVAQTEAALARPIVDEMLADMEKLGKVKAQKLSRSAVSLQRQTARRTVLLIALIVLALALATVVVTVTVRSISRPLHQLVRHAQQLSEGDLTTRTRTEMPGEFSILASAMNQTGESLSRVVSVAAKTADEVSGSADDLAHIAEQISMTASQTATAMSEVTVGAEAQVSQLRGIDQALQSISSAANGVLVSAGEVNELAGEIEQAASEKRAQIGRALAILVNVKETVESASNEVVGLNDTAADINRFVGSVSRIAEQTNLLALNAAIEAARAGASGRGFAVVAEEVRKLAEQAQQAADDIVHMTGVVTARVATASEAMARSSARVIEIERVSRDIDTALEAISNAAERTRIAATAVSTAARGNADAVSSAASGIAAIAKTAEGHAASAEEVSATTEEQSAACEEMTGSTTALQQGSNRLKELVGGLKT